MDKVECTIDHYGTKTWRDLNGKLHKEDGPARIFPNGEKEWWLHGKFHREDGPAKTYRSGGEEWWLNGILHRENGPAKIYLDGEEWWLNGILHREDGPAVTEPNGVIWCLYNREYSFKNWCSKLKKSIEEIIELKLKYG